MVNRPSVIVMGCAGNGLIVAGVCEALGVQVAGFLDDGHVGEEVVGYPVLGGLKDWGGFTGNGSRFVWTLQNAKKQEGRYHLFRDLGMPGELMAEPLVHPRADAPRCKLGRGTVLMPGACVAPLAEVGRNVLIFENAVVDHHAIIGDFAYVCAGAFVGGKVRVGRGAWVGANCTIREELSIGDFALVGCGAVVVDDVKARQTVVGNPARPMR